MFINDSALFKLVEFDQGLLMMNALDSMPGRKHVVLILADAKTCGEYLARYLHARATGAAGQSPAVAHRQAMAGAIVINQWDGHTVGHG